MPNKITLKIKKLIQKIQTFHQTKTHSNRKLWQIHFVHMNGDSFTHSLIQFHG